MPTIKIKKSELQLASAMVVTESKLSKEAKVSLLNFIQNEANSYQLMSFLMDGKIKSITEDSKQIIKDRFASSKHVKFIKESMPSFKDLKTFYKDRREVRGKTIPGALKSTAKYASVNTTGKQKIAAAGTIAGVIGLAFVAYKAAQRVFDKQRRECSKFKGDQFTACMKNAKLKLTQNKIAALNAAKEKCSVAKNPDKCTNSLDKKINEIKGQAS